jgi:hypothetical protein
MSEFPANENQKPWAPPEQPEVRKIIASFRATPSLKAEATGMRPQETQLVLTDAGPRVRMRLTVSGADDRWTYSSAERPFTLFVSQREKMGQNAAWQVEDTMPVGELVRARARQEGHRKKPRSPLFG